MSWPRIVIVDDDTSVRLMLRHLIERINGEVIGEAEDGLAGLNAVELLQPDVLIMDVSMPMMGGFETARQVHATMPGLAIIFVSQHADQPYVDEAFRCGAKGYVLKQAAATELSDAIHAIMQGDLFRSPRINH